MAFLYSLWTFKDRFPRLRLLPGLDVGPIVLDTCSDPAYAAQLVLDARFLAEDALGDEMRT